MSSSWVTAARGLRVLACLSILGVAGCSGGAAEAPPSASPTSTAPGTDAPAADEGSAKSLWESCYSTFGPTGSAEGDLARLVRDCGPAGGMRPLTPVHVGTQTDQDPVDRFTFEVPAPGKCYRVYAAADGTVDDLDLLLRAPSGQPLTGDVTHDSWPVLPPRAPLCFPEAGTYLLEVSVYKGAGRYALQIWGR